MDEVYIDIRKENGWIKKYFNNADFVSIAKLLNCIEELDSDLENEKLKYKSLENEYRDYQEWVISGKPNRKEYGED